MVFCGRGRRMSGKRRHDRGIAIRRAQAIYLRERTILGTLSQFLADRIFGPHRRDILAADLNGLDDHANQQRQVERERLRRVLADPTRRQASVLRQAQDGDPDDPFAQGLRTTYNELEKQQKAALRRE
jgi:site-specific DNA recombinase